MSQSLYDANMAHKLSEELEDASTPDIYRNPEKREHAAEMRIGRDQSLLELEKSWPHLDSATPIHRRLHCWPQTPSLTAYMH